MNFAPCHAREPLIQKVNKGAQNPALRLASQAKQDHVMFAQNRVDDLGDHGFVVTHDARKEGLSLAKLFEQVHPHFVFNSTPSGVQRMIGTVAELSKRPGELLIHAPNTSRNSEASQTLKPSKRNRETTDEHGAAQSQPKNLTTKTRRREEILCDSSRLRVFVVQISLVAPQKQEPTNSFVPGLDLSLQAALRP